jgi:hypothetical protein
MAASVNELASFEGVDLVVGQDGARASVIDWNFTEALRMDHLNLGNQRRINPSLSTKRFGIDRSMPVAELTRPHKDAARENPRAAFCLNIRKD